MNGDEMRDKIAAAMSDVWERWADDDLSPEEDEWAPATAAALLPTVRGLIADELRAAADGARWVATIGGTYIPADALRARADALAADTEWP